MLALVAEIRYGSCRGGACACARACAWRWRGRSSAGEHLLCKQGVVGSNPIASMPVVPVAAIPHCGHGAGAARGLPEPPSPLILLAWRGLVRAWAPGWTGRGDAGVPAARDGLCCSFTSEDGMVGPHGCAVWRARAVQDVCCGRSVTLAGLGSAVRRRCLSLLMGDGGARWSCCGPGDASWSVHPHVALPMLPTTKTTCRAAMGVEGSGLP